ncbi:HAD family hydrolase [Anaeromyxobacter diazotrophicus]|uniref:HAD family hydrolase n=1 Tax=Anaeromyxobacter diazotrophicus TaxID=2590199 RepID=UPI001F45BF31|nr:HAD family phosphatase [Anaeromyxobacter diazotrophicus]
MLFDIDGTLVDSVDLHARAWQEALARYGKEVPYDEIRSQIGKGGDQLLPVFLNDEELERFGDDLAEYRTGLYQRQYLPWAKPFPGARELLARLKQGGELVGLASSCKRMELGYYLRMLGGASLIDAATTAEDAEQTKPHPDIFLACLDRLAMDPDQAVAVGDSPYDAQAAARAGVHTVGLLSGGFEQRTLEEAGCVAIYQDCADLLARLPATPLAPEPASEHRR